MPKLHQLSPLKKKSCKRLQQRAFYWHWQSMRLAEESAAWLVVQDQIRKLNRILAAHQISEKESV